MTIHDWQDWLQHPGTQAFFTRLTQEWGAGGQRFEGMFNTIADSRDDDATNFRKMQQIAVARREILRLLKWPEEEISRLRHLEAQDETNPRKPLEPALVGQSRRGGL